MRRGADTSGVAGICRLRPGLITPTLRWPVYADSAAGSYRPSGGLNTPTPKWPDYAGRWHGAGGHVPGRARLHRPHLARAPLSDVRSRQPGKHHGVAPIGLGAATHW